MKNDAVQKMFFEHKSLHKFIVLLSKNFFMQIKKILSVVLFLGISMSVFAQTVGEQSDTLSMLKGRTAAKINYTIKGVVADELSGEGVPYATVSLKKDSVAPVFLKRVAADVNGKFEIEVSLDSGTYLVHIETTGYQTILQPIEFSDNKKVDAGKFLMKETTTELGEIQVVAVKPLVTQDLDKIGYDVEADPESKTNNVLEMLRKVPLVTVDGEENIQVKGSSSFKIYLNGKPSNMITKNPKDVLKSMPASSIKKIEVITDPGAKYDAEGVTAILNIITQSALQGVQGSIYAGVNTQGMIRTGGRISSKVGKFGVTANYNYQQYGSPSWSESHTTNFGEGMPYKFSDTYTESAYKNGYHYGNLELSYEFDTLNLLSASFGVHGGQWNSRGLKKDKFYSSQTYMRNELGDTISAYNSLGNSVGSYMNYSGNVDYQRTFKKPEQLLTISYLFDFSPNSSENISIVKNNNAFDSILNPKEMNMKYISSGRSDQHTFQIDYTEPFKDKKHTIEAGIKYILRYNGSDNDYKLFNEDTEQYDLDTNRIRNNMDYYQHVFSAYASYTFKLKKFSVRVGGRLEGTFRDIRYTETPNKNFKDKIPQIDPIPSISLNYKPTDKSNFRLSYNNGISRPSIWYLNPYIDDSNPYNISHGNPNLKSERSHRISFSYGYTSKKINLNISAHSSIINNSIERVSTLQEYNGKEGVLVSTYENIGQSATIGGSVYFNYNPCKWLRFSINGGGNYSEYKNNDYTYGNYRLYVSGNFNFSLPWKLKLNLGGSGYMPWSSYKFKGTTWWYGYYISMSRSFLKNDQLTISLDARSPFEKYRTYGYKSWEDGIFERNQISKYLAYSFGLSVSWRFGEMKAQIKKAERGISNDDMKSGSGSNGSSGQGGGN